MVKLSESDFFACTCMHRGIGWLFHTVSVYGVYEFLSNVVAFTAISMVCVFVLQHRDALLSSLCIHMCVFICLGIHEC